MVPAMCCLRAAFPWSSHRGRLRRAEGRWRTRARVESTRVSDLTRVPSRSTQRTGEDESGAEMGKGESFLGVRRLPYNEDVEWGNSHDFHARSETFTGRPTSLSFILENLTRNKFRIAFFVPTMRER